MLKPKDGWKISIDVRTGTNTDNDHLEQRDVMICYTSEEAEKVIEKMINERAGFNHLPLEYGRYITRRKNLIKVELYKPGLGYGGDYLMIFAKKVEFVELEED